MVRISYGGTKGQTVETEEEGRKEAPVTRKGKRWRERERKIGSMKKED